MKSFAALLALVAVVSCQKWGPKGRIIPFEEVDCYAGDVVFIADKSNLCWFWQCKADKTGLFALIPRRCALGSKMPSAYTTGKSNPCVINFNKETDFDCTRTEDSFQATGEPACLSQLDCKNNGTAVYENRICWCDCPDEWKGADDCSKPTKFVTVDGVGEKDEENCFYDEPPCDRNNGCENGGICHNLCKDFWCDCPTPFTRGKRCESFDCDTNPCKNGGTCDRGENDQDEVNLCKCPPGYSGLLCENVVEIEFVEQDVDESPEVEETVVAAPVATKKTVTPTETNTTTTDQ